MEVEHKGEFKDVNVLVMSFPYSNGGFAVALPAENQECLLEGMKELFRQVGGVPRKIRIDNMSTAVTQVKSKTVNIASELSHLCGEMSHQMRWEEPQSA